MSSEDKDVLSPSLVSLVEQITHRRLQKTNIILRQEQRSVVNVILFKILRWAQRSEVDSQHLIRGAVKISNEMCVDTIRKAIAYGKIDSLEDHPELAVTNQFVGNTTAEANSLSFELWEKCQILSYRQFVSILFKFNEDRPNFLLGLLRERLVSLAELATRLRVSEDEVKEIILSLPWTAAKISVFIHQHENKTCTIDQVAAARRDGRNKLKK